MIGLFRRLFAVFREYDATLGGWRFDDIKKHIDARLQSATVSEIAESHSLALAAAAAQSGRRPRFAFVSNLPPEDTGIATCSLNTWLGYDHALDIFSPVVDVDWFLANGARLKAASGGRVSLYDQRVFMAVASQQDYEAIIIATGNSMHCFYIHEMLKKIEAIGATARTILYIHDPVLLHMIQRGIPASNSQFCRSLQRIYDRTIDISDVDHLADWQLWTKLIARNIYGMRYFASLGVKGFIVNSQAARAMLERDLDGLDLFKATIFHPVFPSNAPEDMPRGAKPDGLSVGTFGVPNDSKRTREIAEAVALLRKRGRRVRFLIAGYQANHFLGHNRDLLAHPDTEIFDGPTDRQLLRAIRTVDVAVQLRLHALGESSGVVPMLIEAGIPTIVAGIGAFVEFGDAVHQIPADAPPAAIADAILEAATSGPSPDAMRRYTDDHHPTLFQRRLEAIIDDWAAFRAAHGKG